MYCLHLFYHLNVTMLQCYNVTKTVNQIRVRHTFAPQTLNMIERLSAGPIQEKRGLRENHSARLCRFA